MSQINEVQTEFERLQEEFEKQLKELLLGQDWSTAGDLILAQKGKKRNRMYLLYIANYFYSNLIGL